MITSVTIGGTTYNATARIAARIHLESLTRTLQGYDDFSFAVRGGSPVPTWTHGTAVSVTIDFGAGAVLKFTGEITDRSTAPGGPLGWTVAYTCQGLKYQADRVPITAPDLSGIWALNRTPDDPYFDPSDAGLTIGQILTRVLTIQSTADALAAVGMQYASLSPPTLHADTVADLALLTIVPPQPVQLGGESVLNILEQHLSRWMPKFVPELPPTGILRFKDTTDAAVFVPMTLTLPSDTGTGDPGVEWPSVRSSTRACATRIVLRGVDIAAVQLLSTADGTLVKAWSGGDETAWRLTDFEAPGDAKDDGAVISLTSTSALIKSTDVLKTAALNFWSGREAVVYLTNPVATGIGVTEYRRVTSNTAETAGANFTVTWDSSQPLDASGYTKFRMVGTGGSKLDVGRLFSAREPVTGHTGLNTYVGSHLVVRSSVPIKWANNTKSVDVYYSTALVVAGTVSTETPLGVEPLPSTGQFRLVQSDCTVAGSKADLETNGYPTTTAKGKPTDVQILAIYSRGANQVAVPPDVSGVPQYEGTGFTVEGLQVTRTIDVPSYADQWDATAMSDLAQQHLDTIKDTIYEGTGSLLVEPTFDVLEFNYAINYAIDGTTSPWSAINAPVRSVTISWPQASGSIHKVSFSFSNQRRPFSGDDLYLHPSFTGQSTLGQLQGFGMESFAGQQIVGSFEMPGSQDQGSYSAEDLGITGQGNNFKTSGQNRIEGINPANQVRPETQQDAARRQANNPPAAAPDREQAMIDDQWRRVAIDKDWDARHPDDNMAGGGG